MAEERVYSVDGMTCGHCRVAVEEEVRAVPGVREAKVDLEAGRLTVIGDDVDDAAIAVAVAGAGYEVRS